jgi:hypothetical protein
MTLCCVESKILEHLVFVHKNTIRNLLEDTEKIEVTRDTIKIRNRVYMLVPTAVPFKDLEYEPHKYNHCYTYNDAIILSITKVKGSSKFKISYSTSDFTEEELFSIVKQIFKGMIPGY